MKFISTIVILGSICLWGMTTQAQAPTVPKQPTVEDVVRKFADQYHVSAERMLTTMICESGLNPGAIGDQGRSYGISQIFLPAHTEVSVEQAQDIYFSAEFMAREFSKNNEKIWTCYRQIFLN